MCARAALWCALVLIAGAHAYTIDCNHEFTDCDSELSKLKGGAEAELLPGAATTTEEEYEAPMPTIPPRTIPPTRSTALPVTETTEPTSTQSYTTETTTEEESNPGSVQDSKLRGRLLNLSEDDLKNFAMSLHNQTSTKNFTDLSDVNLDGDDDIFPSKLNMPSGPIKPLKGFPDKFYTNLQAPFQHSIADETSDEVNGDQGVCSDNGVYYKVGEQMNRACEETCECMPTETFTCFPRCKHPYIRRGRTISDPLCFEKPVDECCSIIACATGNGDTKVSKLEVCKYGNDSYLVGNTWNVGCEQRCTCEKNAIITCRPRCPPLTPSEKCINVQDPKDACCEVQVCDVSQDVHEDHTDNATHSTTAGVEKKSKENHLPTSSTMRPLVLTEPIGSIKVLHNNTVQVTLMHANSSEDPIHLLLSDNGGATFGDVELKYDNLILNLQGGKDYILKTKETGTKFNFTITTMGLNMAQQEKEELVEVPMGKIGCTQDGKFYEVGEEFHIGCSELCECTGDGTRECAALECPSHVGLELMSKGCVRWAPSPPPTPPNCCPRAARCLSDGTCHYKGVPIPNWTDVPISLSGCEQRCFCENGVLDCQEVCSPLPPLPPPHLRCPPGRGPTRVNVSDEDCCQQWGCLPNAGVAKHTYSDTTSPPLSMKLPPLTVALPPRRNKPSESHAQLNLKQFISELDDDSLSPSDNLTVFNFEHVHLPSESEEQMSFDNDTDLGSDEKKYGTQISDNTFTFSPIKAAVLPKQPIYKIVHNTLPKVQPNPVPPTQLRNNMKGGLKRPLATHKLEPLHNHKHEPLSILHQPVFFMPASRTRSQLQPKVPSEPHFIVKNLSMHYPERFALPIPVKPAETKNRKGNYMTPLNNLAMKPVTDRNRWDQNTKMHVLLKTPNPYENVLQRTIPNLNIAPSFLYDHEPATKAFSSLDLENLLTQMEVESEANRNLDQQTRSADRKRLIGAGKNPSPEVQTSTQSQVPKAPFLPTVPPDPSIHFPDEDYEHNNIHRPVNSLVPGLPQGLPSDITVPPGYGDNKKLTVITLVSDSPTSVKMLFGLPPVLVGLRGSVDLRYTDKADEEITHWYSQVFAPADEILTTSRLEFRLTGLKPSTVYKMRGKLYLHNLPVEPESDIYSIKTQDLPPVEPVEVKRKVVDSRLAVQELNDSVAHITWRRFTEEEIQFIDAIQVRYRPVGNPIYSMTELLHHSRDSVFLTELRPGSRYEASLVLVPPPRATTELQDPAQLEFNTAAYIDPYNWSVQLEARSVGAEAAELTWRGVPAPAERWVRVYRAAHACGAGAGAGAGAARQEHDAFRLATRDQTPALTLSGLAPDTRCRVWLELFLTNGKVKTSNVLEINTKSLDSPEPIDNVIEASSVGGMAPRGDYYGALVVVGVVAALGALTSLLLLLVVVRRHRPRSVPITPVPTAPRESSLPPYDNPAYKLELQQETMDL